MADRPRVEDVIRDMADDALAETAVEMKAESYRLMRMAELALHELGNRMEDRGASKLDTEHWNGTLRPGPLIHHVDPGKMEKLRQHLTPEEWDDVYVLPPAPERRWSHSVLNELVKRGGLIRVAIEAARTSIRDRSKLELERKKEVAS